MMIGTALCLLALQSSPKFEVVFRGIRDADLSKSTVSQLELGVKTVEAFFGVPFKKSFKVVLFAHRSDLDAEFKSRWKAPPTEKWMVAAGISDTMYVLSPRVWKTEAVGHDGDDATEVQKIVTHELTHVFHGQANPRPQFDGMDEMAWFIEGIATYVAGQLEGRALTGRHAIDAGKDPKTLKAAWDGQYRYGVSGSIVRYVDVTYGRKKLVELLKLTKTADVLKSLGTTETKLISGWRAYELSR